MLKVLLIALVVTTAVVLLVARLDMRKVGLRVLQQGEPDLTLGVIAIVLSVAAVVANILYGREDAPASASIMINTYAAIGFAWGLSQVVGAKKWAKKRKRTPKARRDEIAHQ